MPDTVMSDADRHKADREKAKATGLHIYGCPKTCRGCGGRSAYGSGTPNWQNRVVCLDCGKKWSQ